MANMTRNLYAILLLIAIVLHTGAYGEEQAEDETLSTDRNSLTSIRLPSKCLTGKKKGLESLVVLKAWGHSIRGGGPQKANCILDYVSSTLCM
jgi:hypothetical protein